MTMKFANVSFVYGQESKYPVIALQGIDFEIQPHEFVGLIGHTGSGKSTLVQHMNGLNIPTSGTVVVQGIDTSGSKKELKKLRQMVGLVFQYPEDQLFEETVEKDIAFGPKNLGLSTQDIEERVRFAMECVGLSYEEYRHRSPFDLSGGQKRRVAIAGVLALKPQFLVLDEPTAGLDPKGREEILSQIDQLYKNDPKLSIILVTHSMEDIAEHAKRIIVVNHGNIVMDDTPKNVFQKRKELEGMGLSIPQVTSFMQCLKEKGIDIDDSAINVDDAFREISRFLDERRRNDEK